jgi:hypothetical protein
MRSILSTTRTGKKTDGGLFCRHHRRAQFGGGEIRKGELNYVSKRLPAAKITQIKEFTPAGWAKANAKEKVIAQAA